MVASLQLRKASGWAYQQGKLFRAAFLLIEGGPGARDGATAGWCRREAVRGTLPHQQTPLIQTNSEKQKKKANRETLYLQHHEHDLVPASAHAEGKGRTSGA